MRLDVVGERVDRGSGRGDGRLGLGAERDPGAVPGDRNDVRLGERPDSDLDALHAAPASSLVSGQLGQQWPMATDH